MITINLSQNVLNSGKELEIEAPYGINFKIDGIKYQVSEGKEGGIEVRKISSIGYHDISVEKNYTNQVLIK